MSYTIKGMNKFAKLSEQIPREPEAWTCEDVSEWLKLMEMSQYVSNFRNMSIDGWIIFDIEEDDLINDLKISKKLHRKKIMKGIQILRDYKLYIRNHLMKKDFQNETLFGLTQEEGVKEQRENMKSDLEKKEEMIQFNDQTRCHGMLNTPQEGRSYKFLEEF